MSGCILQGKFSMAGEDHPKAGKADGPEAPQLLNVRTVVNQSTLNAPSESPEDLPRARSK